tara:strand:+ start:520 stop:1260 length:741 start_codon:yes stop_codon:yes gene_type:complete
MIKRCLILLFIFLACTENTETSIDEVINESTTTSTIAKATTTTTTTTTTIPRNNLITMHDPSERTETFNSKYIDLYPGYEGHFDLLIQVAVNQLPDPFRTILKEEIIIINGCHPYGKAIFGRCVHGVFDPGGYDEKGNPGNEWARSIWISDRGIESGHLKDILLHEAAHAYSLIELQECKEPGGESYRNLAHKKFSGEENLADIFVYFYGGKWTHYIDLEYLSIEDHDWILEMMTYCDLYKREKNT